MTDDELVQFVLDNAQNLWLVVYQLKAHTQTRNSVAAKRIQERKLSKASSLDRLHKRTVQQATRHRYEWTGPELELADRSDLTALEVAQMIGRTLKAVKAMRRKLRRDPRLQALL